MWGTGAVVDEIITLVIFNGLGQPLPELDNPLRRRLTRSGPEHVSEIVAGTARGNDKNPFIAKRVQQSAKAEMMRGIPSRVDG